MIECNMQLHMKQEKQGQKDQKSYIHICLIIFLKNGTHKTFYPIDTLLQCNPSAPNPFEQVLTVFFFFFGLFKVQIRLVLL